MVLSTKQHLCLIRVVNDVLVMTTLAFEDEVVEAPRLEHPATNDKELTMAKALVAQLEVPFEPKHYKDEHRERVLKLLQQKAKGQPLQLPSGATEELVSGSLAEVLERSLAKAKEPEEKAEKSEKAASAKPHRRARTRARRSHARAH